MYSELSIWRAFSSKLGIFSFGILLALFTVLQVSSLEAGGWGKTEEVLEYEGTSWNGVYFDMNGLSFTASIPNFSGAIMKNSETYLKGQVTEGAMYIIATSMNPGFKPPKTLKEFVKIIQDANPTCSVIAVNTKKAGVKYAVDIMPIKQEDTTFFRFISTKDRLIKMGTEDVNANRRHHFFESLNIH